MSQTRHRGPGPKDSRLFSAKALPVLRTATDDLCWLLNRGYGPASALELVGNRHDLTRRQRLAVGRCACADQDRDLRNQRLITPDQLQDGELWIDAFNVILAMEAALGGAVVLVGRDLCCRDIGGVYRRYHRVAETEPALELLGELLQAWGVTGCVWWLDAPVGNSGRLQRAIQDVARRRNWPWQVEMVNNADTVLARAECAVASADRMVLRRCGRWLNLAREAILRRVPGAWLVDLSN